MFFCDKICLPVKYFVKIREKSDYIKDFLV